MKNAAKIWRNFGEDFGPSISREIGGKTFHTNSSTHQDLEFHTAELKFFHSDILGVGGPNDTDPIRKFSIDPGSHTDL